MKSPDARNLVVPPNGKSGIDAGESERVEVGNDEGRMGLLVGSKVFLDADVDSDPERLEPRSSPERKGVGLFDLDEPHQRDPEIASPVFATGWDCQLDMIDTFQSAAVAR